MSAPLAIAGLAVVLLAGGAAGPAVLARRRLRRRIQRLAGRGAAGSPAAADLRRREASSRLDGLAQRLLPRSQALRARLAATGLALSPGHYLAACAGAGLIGATLGAYAGLSLATTLMLALGLALFLPHAAVGSLMARRRARFLKVFAEAIGLIVRGLRAGLPVTQTLSVVGREIAEPVGGEFRTLADQIRLGAPIEEAMWQAARRIGLPEFNFLVISLSVQRETGGNLAETLQNLEQILRRRQQMRLKVRAMSSEAAASALIIGALPFVMGALMSVVSPDYLKLLVTAPLGRLMLGGGIGSLVAGALVMRQMVRFEI